MGSFTDYLEGKVLEHIVGKTTYAAPSAYVGLYTATPSDLGGGTEVISGGYARQYVPGSAWSVATSAGINNIQSITFNQATGSWGTITGIGLSDSISGGNMLAWGTLSVSKTIGSGDTPSFAAGQLTITLD